MTYYKVSQYNHGAEHRWIFDENTIVSAIGYIIAQNNYSLDEGVSIDCHWPIGGSNSSATWFQKVKSEEDIRKFLTSPGDGPEWEDPALVDIAEYYCSVDVDDYWSSDKSCTGEFVDKLGLICEDSFDERHEEIEGLLMDMKDQGYTDFDYENPLYGNNRDMTYSELCDLYEKVTGRRCNHGQRKDFE